MRVFGLNRQFNWVARREWVELTGKQRDRLRALKLWQDPQFLTDICAAHDKGFGFTKAFDVVEVAAGGFGGQDSIVRRFGP